MLFSELKRRHRNVELVREVVKQWAYEGRRPESFDQVCLFGRQLELEHRLLPHVELLVTDSPLLLGAYYARLHLAPCHEELARIAAAYEAEYPGLYVLLDRPDVPFQSEGRIHTEAESLAADVQIEAFVGSLVPPERIVRCGHDELADLAGSL